MTESVASLGRRLRERREQLGISQAQAARELDVARTAYRLWEMEAAKPSPDRWRLVARWLGVSITTILLAAELLDEGEAGDAERLETSGGGWEDDLAPERGDIFAGGRAMIERGTRRGVLTPGESDRLAEALARIQGKSPLHASRGWRPAIFRKDLSPNEYAPRTARTAVVATAAGIPAEQLGVAELLASELVTNSVQHSGAGPDDAIGLTILVGRDVLRVEVADGSQRPARPRSPDASGGWGLALVFELASRWGAGQVQGWNVTWFELDLPQPGEREEALEEPIAQPVPLRAAGRSKRGPASRVARRGGR